MVITQYLREYCSAREELWNLFAEFYDVENDWELVDFHDDVTHLFFNLSVGRKFGLSSDISPSRRMPRMPLREILVSARTPEIACLISQSFQNWQTIKANKLPPALYFVDPFSFEGAFWPRHFSYILCQDNEKNNVLFPYLDVTAVVRKGEQSNNMNTNMSKHVKKELVTKFEQCVGNSFAKESNDSQMELFLERVFCFLNERISSYYVT